MATNDLDYLCARLHARRSRMAEGEHLANLCRSRNVPDLGRAVRPEYDFSTAADFQRQLLQDLIQEYSFCLQHLGDAQKELVAWMQARFQIENIKVLLRGLLNRTPLESLRQHLVTLPHELGVDAAALLAAETPIAFAKQLPAGFPRKHLERAMALNLEQADAFVLEAAMDGGYFQELRNQIERLADEEKRLITPMARQQLEQFHLMLVVRGKFHHGYSSETLMALHAAACVVSVEWFKALLAASDLSAVAELGLGRVFDESPADRGAREELAPAPATLESHASRRLLRLANGAFRKSHIGFAAVVGYLEMRRIEVANLITVSEGVRLGVAPESIHVRLIRRAKLELEV